MENRPRIFATLAWGFDPETWGAIGFSNEGVRNHLASELQAGGGLVLTMGTTGDETPEPMRGRLMGLHQVGLRAISTKELVEPSRWASHLADNNERPKWPYGLPILSAERFSPPVPMRAQILPRLHHENLHQKLASNFEELTEEEVARVMRLPREPVAEIWSSPAADFNSHLLRGKPVGPPPLLGTRTLSSASGPAVTYCFKLVGHGSAAACKTLRTHPRIEIFKVGFSNNPVRRSRELNAYLPDHEMLQWKPQLQQWHSDEINAWALEQEIFRRLQASGAVRVQGEIYAVDSDLMQAVWNSSLTSARRPTEPVEISEETGGAAKPRDLGLAVGETPNKSYSALSSAQALPNQHHLRLIT